MATMEELAADIGNRWKIFKEAMTIVDEKFEDGRGFAVDSLRQASETIQKLSNLASSLQGIDVNVSIPDFTPPDIEDFVGEAPDKPNIQMNMPEELSEVDDLGSAVHDKLLHDITEATPAIPEEIEEAIFKRGTERDELLLQDAIDKISAEWSKRGFTLPNGMLMADISQAVIEYNNKRLDGSREIAIKNFELSEANMRFAIEKALSWIANKIQVYQAKVQAEIARVDAIVRAFLGEVDVYKGSAQVYTALVETKIKGFDAQIKAAVARADLIIKDAEIDIEQYKALNQLKIEAMKAIAGVHAQVVAGALSSVSAGAHISASNAAAYSYSPTQSPSIND